MNLDPPLISKNANGVLRVIIPGRISKETQDIKSIAVTQADNESWLKSVYSGKDDITRLGEQASGWLADRPSMERAKSMIDADQCDLVLMGEIRELYRNPAFIFDFVHNCIDNNTRFIARWDQIDTAVEGWEVNLHIAVLKHGIMVPETRRRVRRKATDTFHSGGMVMKVRFGYRKLTKEEAASGEFVPVGLRIAKVEMWTPVFKDIRRLILSGYSDVMVADWLAAEGIPPPPYATSGKWTGQVVCGLLTDPILSGQRKFRKTISRMILKSGKHRSEHNPSPLEAETCPELAHYTVAEHVDLLRYFCHRKAKNRSTQKSGRDSPLYGQRRDVSLWPGQSLVCSACKGMFYVLGHTMKCQHTLSKNAGDCWNHVSVTTQAVRDAVLPILLAAILRDSTAKAKMLATTWDEYQTRRRKWSSMQSGDEMELAEIKRHIARLVKALIQDDGLDSVREELTVLEKKKKTLMVKLAKRTAPEFEFGEYASAEAMGGDLPRVLDLMTRTSRPFALLLRRLLTECSIVPVQALDSGQVRPRLRFAINITPWAGPLEPVFEERHEVDLFPPPVHIQHIEACRTARREHPDKTLRELAVVLGINYMTVKRALDYGRRMEREGLTESYRVLSEAPASASRWKKRRSKTTDEPPGPLLDENN